MTMVELTARLSINGLACLDDLPAETMTHIIGLTDPGSHLNLACTCKFVWKCSQEVLRRHREAHATWSEVTDVEASTVPTLLRLVVTDPIVAWHVRKLEFWGSRYFWTQWRPISFTREESNERGPFGAGPPLDWGFAKDEIRRYLELMRSVLLLGEDTLESAWHDIEKGCDGPLKVLLMALCPRLTTLQYVRTWNDDGGTSQPRDSSIFYLQKVLNKQPSTDLLSWAPGLRNLSQISIGIHSGGEYAQVNYWNEADILADLLKLPNLETLYFRGLKQRDITERETDDEIEDWPGRPYSFPDSCPQLRKLFLEGTPTWRQENDIDVSNRFTRSLFRTCNGLEAVSSLWMSFDRLDDIPAALGRSASATLRSFMPFGNRSRTYEGSTYSLQTLSTLPNLRLVNFDIKAILRSMPDYSTQERDWKGDYHITATERPAVTTLDFPASLEVLVLLCYETLNNVEALFVDDTLAAMLESGAYQHLKAIYLEPLRRFKRLDDGWPFPHRWKYPKTIAAGERSGIEIHTSWEYSHMRHPVDWPRAPDTRDLIGGPFGAHIREISSKAQETFNPYRGYWEYGHWKWVPYDDRRSAF